MGKSTHFSGQPLYCQVIKLLDKSRILRLSREYGGEHYVKSLQLLFSFPSYLSFPLHMFIYNQVLLQKHSQLL